MKVNAPYECPVCGEKDGWKFVETSRRGFSAGKAVVGGMLFGPLGLLVGIMGKRKVLFCCRKCGFSNYYDIEWL